MRLISIFKEKNITCAYLYFYIHLITEVVCFFYLSRVTNNSLVIWLIPFIYDALAFVPQSIIGYINDLHPNINSGFIGVVLLVMAYLIYALTDMNIYVSLILLALGNAFIHISGAENTLKVSGGKLSFVSIFVGGGSFGVILGKLLARIEINPMYLVLLILTMIPFMMLAKTYEKDVKAARYEFVNEKINPFNIILIATFIVIIRGYMGYGIPTNWNKTTLETVLLFFTMGIGKCLGGILSDAYGIRKVGIISTLLAIPFLSFGDDIMVISLVGVMMFSMTMAITLGMLVSVLNENKGLAFGFTTIGLFLGTMPIFFISITSKITNILMIVLLSLICSMLFSITLKKENNT